MPLSNTYAPLKMESKRLEKVTDKQHIEQTFLSQNSLNANAQMHQRSNAYLGTANLAAVIKKMNVLLNNLTYKGSYE